MRGLEAYSSSSQTRVAAMAAVTLVLLLAGQSPSLAVFSASSLLATATPAYTGVISWAIGYVLPQGSIFSDGRRLSWPSATNITSVVRLPKMGATDGPTLAILSLMTEDSNVLQIAAGLYSGSTVWRAYAWLIRNAQSRQVYSWVLNGSMPEMRPGALVDLSLLLSAGGWRYKVIDVATGSAVRGSFGSGIDTTPKSGEQEVFSLESYSSNSSVFHEMGNMTLESLFVNGGRIASGGYFYGSWDPAHSPLFVVGSANPPPFIAVERMQNGTIVWSYQSNWIGNESSSPLALPTEPLLVLLLLGSLGTLAFIVVRLRRMAG